MPNQPSFAERSYQLHEAHLAQQSQQERDPLERLTKLKNSLDDWRHERMYEQLVGPLLGWGGPWLTIGDGIGTDAHWLIRQGASAVASDIGDALLQKVHDLGFIQEFRKENAEKINLPDNSFDFALCKEAYHHFPRPYMAVYEMLRVSKKAIVLIEPQDPVQSSAALLFLKNILGKFSPYLLGKIWKNQFSFETVGNYVYKLSDREMEKVAMGMGLPAVAFCGLNDYVKGGPEMREIPPNPTFFGKVKRSIAFRNLLSRLGLVPYRLLSCIIFKEKPPQSVIAALREKGYQYVELPENPYANA
jgi:ubiquinone/menaquinone biosynthesis C-methylase UbiE